MYTHYIHYNHFMNKCNQLRIDDDVNSESRISPTAISHTGWLDIISVDTPVPTIYTCEDEATWRSSQSVLLSTSSPQTKGNHPGSTNWKRCRLEAFLVKKRAESLIQHNSRCAISRNLWNSKCLQDMARCSRLSYWSPWLWIFYSWSVLYCGRIQMKEAARGTCDTISNSVITVQLTQVDEW